MSARRAAGSSFTWALLALNAMTFYPGTWSGQPLIIPIPSASARSSPRAPCRWRCCSRSVNRRLAVRPNVFLCLVSLLARRVADLTTRAGQHFGTIYRTSGWSGSSPRCGC